jgi:type II secretory pathway component PulF
MAIFRWQGVSPRGDTISGEMEAATRDAVLARLRAQRIQPIPAKIRQRGKGFDKDIAIPASARASRHATWWCSPASSAR